MSLYPVYNQLVAQLAQGRVVRQILHGSALPPDIAPLKRPQLLQLSLDVEAASPKWQGQPRYTIRSGLPATAYASWHANPDVSRAFVADLSTRKGQRFIIIRLNTGEILIEPDGQPFPLP